MMSFGNKVAKHFPINVSWYVGKMLRKIILSIVNMFNRIHGYYMLDCTYLNRQMQVSADQEHLGHPGRSYARL